MRYNSRRSRDSGADALLGKTCLSSACVRSLISKCGKCSLRSQGWGKGATGRAYREAFGGEAQVEDEIQDLVVQGAIKADQGNACTPKLGSCISKMTSAHSLSGL